MNNSLPLDSSRHGDFYESIGGENFFRTLVRHFYVEVRQDQTLWPMYPEHRRAQLAAEQGKNPSEGAEHRLATFLMQYWGGPKIYGAERGHPRLRMRHAPYAVSPSAKDAWLKHMRKALDTTVQELEIAPLLEETLWDYLERAAISLINTHEGGPAPMAGEKIPDQLQ